MGAAWPEAPMLRVFVEIPGATSFAFTRLRAAARFSGAILLQQHRVGFVFSRCARNPQIFRPLSTAESQTGCAINHTPAPPVPPKNLTG